jgi:hypothetical protein
VELFTLKVAMTLVATACTINVCPAYAVQTLLMTAIILSLVSLANLIANSISSSRAAIVTCVQQARLISTKDYWFEGFWACLLGYRLWMLGLVWMQLWIVEEFIIVWLCWIIWSHVKQRALRRLLSSLVFWRAASEVDWDALFSRACNYTVTVIFPVISKVSLWVFQTLVIFSAWSLETFKATVRWWSPYCRGIIADMSLWEQFIYKDWMIAQRMKRDAEYAASPILHIERPKDYLTLQREKAEEALKAQEEARLRTFFINIHEKQALEARRAKKRQLLEEARAKRHRMMT